MKIKKIITLSACFLTVGLLMTACSQTNQTTTNTSQTESKIKKIGFMGLANENKEHIWYRTSSIKKDARIKGIYVTKGGKITYYHLITYKPTKSGIDSLGFESNYNIEFSDLKGLSDKEIIAKAKKLDKKSYTSLYQSYIESTEYAIQKWPEDDEFQNYVPQVKLFKEYLIKLQGKNTYENYRKSVTNKKLSALVSTDDSGNVVDYERIEKIPWFDEKEIDYNDSEGERYSLKDKGNSTLLALKPSNFEFGTIYDSRYVLLDGFIMTKDIPDDTMFTFDTVDTKNVKEEK